MGLSRTAAHAPTQFFSSVCPQISPEMKLLLLKEVIHVKNVMKIPRRPNFKLHNISLHVGRFH